MIKEIEWKGLINSNDYYKLLLFSKQNFYQINYLFGEFDEIAFGSLRIRYYYCDCTYEISLRRVVKDVDSIFEMDNISYVLSEKEALFYISNGISNDIIYNLFGINCTEKKVLFKGIIITRRAKFNLDELEVNLDLNIYDDNVDYEIECELTNIYMKNKLLIFLNENNINYTNTVSKARRFFNYINGRN